MTPPFGYDFSTAMDQPAPLSQETRVAGLWASAAMQRVQKIIEHSAASDLPVLITGEIGAGKDLIAREIHRQSHRAHAPLLKLHCAALANDFFDLSRRRNSAAPHPLHTIDGGTLFLDDIGELSLVLQDKLLDLLRASDVQPTSTVGLDGMPAFRVIAATHHDLTHAIDVGTFCEDLFYRINLVHVHIP